MPRSARFVVPGVAHHVTQRGTDRQTVFHSRADRLTYLHLVREQASLGHVSILAYCLMSNHIHLVAVPEEEAALAEFMQRVHGRYAQYLNARRGRCGHLWQNRYNSCALGPRHLWAALRYVELNPVRARLVTTPREYTWSSAEAHLSGADPWRIADLRFWSESGGAERWRALLSQRDDEADAKALRRATYSGQPFGDEEFVEILRRQRENTRAGRHQTRLLPSEEALAFAAY
jgi:putative transposase